MGLLGPSRSTQELDLLLQGTWGAISEEEHTQAVTCTPWQGGPWGPLHSRVGMGTPSLASLSPRTQPE